MDNPQEYEVESVTRARVHDKRGKKITWRYYVKWKGYGLDENTWEPTDSFQGGSEHFLETFWERIDTGGRDISDATAFKKGEELFVSGPPGRKSTKRKASPSKTQESPSKNESSSVGVTVSAPLPRKRRRVQSTTDDEQGSSKPKRSASIGGSKNGRISARSSVKRTRVSSPLRKSVRKRQPSAGDSQLDADGETDPDVVEVEDELMQVSAEDVEEEASKPRRRAKARGSANGPQKNAFEDLEHFYSGNPIDIDQPMDEQGAVEKPESRPSPPPASPPTSDDVVPDSQGSPDPLFDSPSRFPDKTPEIQGDSVPQHRARAAKPLVKLIDATTLESTSQQTRITTKARLLSNHSTEILPSSGPSHDTTRRGRKPGPSRSSVGLVKRNRSSLLTATKGTLKSIKGKFSGAVERDRPEEIEEASASRNATEGNELDITSWSDEEIVVAQDGQTPSTSHSAPLSGELLALAGQQAGAETLPDYEEENGVAEAQGGETQESGSSPVLAKEDLPHPSLVEVTEAEVIEARAVDGAADAPPPVLEAGQQAAVGDSSVSSVDAPPADEAVKKSIELAKEQLFPSAHASFSSFSSAQPSFRTTIFGPLYQGHTKDNSAAISDELSTTFKVILRDGVELPLALKDCSEIKAQISDILIGNTSGSKVALFYSAVDALAMVSTLKSDGTARVVLDTSAEMVQQEHFSALLQRFESSHTLIAPVGKEVCVLYSSENVDIAEKLGAPEHLRGLSRTLLISHASIENQLAYVAAIMKATAL